MIDDSEEFHSLKDFLDHNLQLQHHNDIKTIKKYPSSNPELIFLDLVMPNFDVLNVLKN